VVQSPAFLTPQSKKRRDVEEAESPRISSHSVRAWCFDSPSDEIRRVLRRSVSTGRKNSGEGTHYLALSPRFEIYSDGEYRCPVIYQPTPEGLRALVDAHGHHNSVDFRVHEKSPATPDKIADRVTEFLTEADLSSLNRNHPIAAILCFEQNHAIPIFLAVHEARKVLLVLDSTSGPIAQQYWAIARRFPDFEVRLNAGTRQADNQSCLNDAFEILKQCFTVGNLLERVEARGISTAAPLGNSRLHVRRESQPDNFSLFKLPEELAFVVQRAGYFDEYDLDMGRPITVEGRTCPLGMHVIISTEFGRKHRTDADGSSQVERMKVNAYLYKASRDHRDTIEARLS
jgi:hypothetical protein